MAHCKSFAFLNPRHLAALLLAIGLVACSSLPTSPSSPSSSPSHSSPQPAPDMPLSGAALPATASQWVLSEFSALPNWDTSDLSEHRQSLLSHCAVLLKKPALQAWQVFCAALQLDSDPKGAIQAHLLPYAQLDAQGKTKGLATAYYEPVFAASLQAGSEFQWPLYALPSGEAMQLPRKVLTPEAGVVHAALQGRELAWLADPIDAYLVHVQGSTRLKLPDGSIIRLAYAGNNGQVFSSAANALIQQGVFKAHEASNERLRVWARTQTSAQVQAALNSNARFIFFKRDATPPEQGPAGALGLPLSLHSVAVDPAFTPLGSLLWLDTPAQPAGTLKLAQDTGSAIKGAARVDMYFGTGEAAGEAAGKVKHPARVWLLWPK